MDGATKQKPSREAVQNLMQMYPRLDFLLAETILSFTEEQLEIFLEKKSTPHDIEDDDQIGKIEP